MFRQAKNGNKGREESEKEEGKESGRQTKCYKKCAKILRGLETQGEYHCLR